MPEAIRIGIDYNDFWNLNPRILEMYRDRYDDQMKQMDYLAWRTGLYVMNSIVSAFDESVDYPETPISMQPTQIENEDGEVESIDKVRFMQWAKAYNKQHNLSSTESAES